MHIDITPCDVCGTIGVITVVKPTRRPNYERVCKLCTSCHEQRAGYIRQIRHRPTQAERTARELSPRGRLLLRLVNARTHFTPEGELIRHYVRTADHEPLDGTQIYVGGTYDALIFRGLIRRELIDQLPGHHMYAVTQFGREVAVAAGTMKGSTS